MDFLKKHYEKIVLGVMLAGLIGVLIFMLFYIASQTEEMEKMRTSYFSRPAHPLNNLDTTVEDSAINRLKSQYNLDLETTNKLLNPMEWQRNMDGTLILKDKSTGPQMVVVTNITPLYLVISLESSRTNEDGVGRYQIKVERQAAPTVAKRLPITKYVSPGNPPNEIFSLVSVKGRPEDPDSLVLKLVDSGDEITITKDKPYTHVEAYSADFRYDPERKAFHGRRVGDTLAFGGEDYKVADITQNELILMDQSNQKKTSLPFTP